MLFYLIGGATFLFSLAVRQGLKKTYNRYSQVPNHQRVPGAHVARGILDANGLQRIPVEATQGKLTDHYDPRTKVIRLSRPIFAVSSVAALAISAHESGHAIQDHEQYGPLKFRTAMAPIASFAGRAGIPALIAGSVFGSQWLVLLGVVAYVGALLLQFLTLPVEFNASKRALAQLESLHLMNEQEKEGAQRVLRAAAMTYVAGVASAAGYIVYLALAGGRMLFKKPPVVPPSIPPMGPAGV